MENTPFFPKRLKLPTYVQVHTQHTLPSFCAIRLNCMGWLHQSFSGFQFFSSFRTSEYLPRNLKATNKHTHCLFCYEILILYMKNIANLHQHHQNSAVVHKMFQVNIFIQILLCILTIYTWQLFIAKQQPPCPAHDAFGSLLRQIHWAWKNLYLFTYTSQNMFFFSIVYYTLLPHQDPCLFPISPTWSSLPVLKKNELHQILPYLSQKWGRMDLVAEKRHDYNRSREEKQSAVY